MLSWEKCRRPCYEGVFERLTTLKTRLISKGKYKNRYMHSRMEVLNQRTVAALLHQIGMAGVVSESDYAQEQAQRPFRSPACLSPIVVLPIAFGAGKDSLNISPKY